MSHLAHDLEELRRVVAGLPHGNVLKTLEDKDLVDIAVETEGDKSTYVPDNFDVVHQINSGRECFVVNRFSAKCHKVHLHELLGAPPSLWVTACGWKFAHDGLFKTAKPCDNLCNKAACFKYVLGVGQTEGSHDTSASDSAA